MRLSPDGTSMVTFGELGMMRYEMPSGRPMWPAPVQQPACTQLTWAVKIGALLCTEQNSGQLLALDPGTGVSMGSRYDTGVGSGVGFVSPDGTTLVEVAGDEKAFSVWRLDSTDPVTARLGGLDAEWLNGYSAGGALLVGHGGQALRMVDPVAGTVLGQLDGVEYIVPNASGGRPAAIYLDHTIGWYDLDHQAPAGPKTALPLPLELPIPDSRATRAAMASCWPDAGRRSGPTPSSRTTGSSRPRASTWTLVRRWRPPSMTARSGRGGCWRPTTPTSSRWIRCRASSSATS